MTDVTEEDWLKFGEPEPMLRWCREQDMFSRKIRLFAVACCRRIWPLLTDERSRRAVEAAEEIADIEWDEDDHDSILDAAQVAAEEAEANADSEGFFAAERDDEEDAWLRHECRAAADAAMCSISHDNDECSSELAASAARNALRFYTKFVQGVLRGEAQLSVVSAELKSQMTILRCIFGNPFRPVTLTSAWLTAPVRQLAQAIYDDRAFDRLPLLADALEEAGCDNADVLQHCRQGGEHVRGCWVVDLVLDRE